MSIWQIGIAVLYIAAILWGRPDNRLTATVFANFAGTMFLADSPHSVAVLDLVCLCVLLRIGTIQGDLLAAIFATLIPVYVLGHLMEWPQYTVYAIVDIAAIAIAGILASGTGGYRGRRGADIIRRISVYYSEQAGRVVARRF